MTIRVRFVGGYMDGYADDMAPDEMATNSPMYIGCESPGAGVQLVDKYVIDAEQDEHDIYVFTNTGRFPAGTGGSE